MIPFFITTALLSIAVVLLSLGSIRSTTTEANLEQRIAALEAKEHPPQKGLP